MENHLQMSCFLSKYCVVIIITIIIVIIIITVKPVLSGHPWEL